mmetsp:Transcript_20784/g.34810  ORF Transcript_20784/g.34810 Transcript_20784/m.34810 type:complete len:253 (-) Transcript_20784:321-1079(-)
MQSRPLNVPLTQEEKDVRIQQRTRLTNLKTTAAETLKTALENLNKIKENRTHWTVHNTVKQLFAKYGVTPSKYNGHDLEGPGCENLLYHWNEIRPRLQLILLDEVAKRTRRPPPDPQQHVLNFMRKIDLFFRSLLVLRSYLYKTKLSDTDTATFSRIARNFGILWRRGFQLPVPPKLHYLESHCVQQAEELGTIGLFCEELIERSHKEDNDLNRIFTSSRDFEKKTNGKRLRVDREKNMGVVAVALKWYSLI